MLTAQVAQPLHANVSIIFVWMRCCRLHLIVLIFLAIQSVLVETNSPARVIFQTYLSVFFIILFK